MHYTSQRPNVILVIVDDLAYGDLSCLGNPYIQTTALDALHEQSVRLTHYCSGPLCTPARAALMTGRHPIRTRAIDTYLGRSNLDGDEVTMAHLFKQAGYRTGLFGKWHLGDTRPSDPNSMGFEEALYHTGGGLRQPANHGCDSYFDPDLLHNGHRSPYVGYCTDIFTEAACDFLKANKAPFFCYLAFNAVHTPLEIVEHWADPFRAQGLPEVWCRLYGMLQNLDENMGKLAACLRANSLSKNTIVVFTADHGPCAGTRYKEQTRFNAGLRGYKGQFYEGGIRVPCFWSWPSQWQARNVQLLSNPIDILPTLEQVCGLHAPSERKLDGVDLSGVLDRQKPCPALTERSICMQWHRGARPIKGRNAVCIGPRYKWYSLEPGKTELYDLKGDPRETKSIVKEKEIIAREMEDIYNTWFDDVCGERQLLNPRQEPGVPILIDVNLERPATVLTWQDWAPYSEQEGWSAGNPGYWLVTLVEKAIYRIVVEKDTDTPPAPLYFRFGGIEQHIPLVEKIRALCFELELPATTDRLHCYFDLNGKKVGIRNLTIRCQQHSSIAKRAGTKDT